MGMMDEYLAWAENLKDAEIATLKERCASLEARAQELTAVVEKQREKILYLQDGSEYSYKQRFTAQELLLDSSNNTAEELTQKLCEKDLEIQRLQNLNVQAQESVLQQKVIVTDHITDSEDYKKSLEHEVMELRAALKARDAEIHKLLYG